MMLRDCSRHSDENVIECDDWRQAMPGHRLRILLFATMTLATTPRPGQLLPSS